ncbi:hypothetical protein LJR219_005165 [Phenylobacterium sp. LjRoot219]|uniref:hypothetical protein n=1 Tax=Phenylobacterium sp. LjRoot219 TaxID=3342283 RepID=UPI003ECF2EC0
MHWIAVVLAATVATSDARRLVRYGGLLIGLVAASCSPLVSSKPSDMTLIVKESRELSPTQVAQLSARLDDFAEVNGLSMAKNGVPGDGTPFALELRDKENTTSIVVTSPFKTTDFVFGLYSRRKDTEKISSQKDVFEKAIRAATAP